MSSDEYDGLEQRLRGITPRIAERSTRDGRPNFTAPCYYVKGERLEVTTGNRETQRANFLVYTRVNRIGRSLVYCPHARGATNSTILRPDSGIRMVLFLYPDFRLLVEPSSNRSILYLIA